MIRRSFNYPISGISRTAFALIGELEQSGYPTYIVGGAVRDALLGVEILDMDLVSTATPEELQAILPEAKLVGAAFGVTLLRRDGFDFEIATAREERNYLDGRHPEMVKYTRNVAVDVLRRDFTINALLYDAQNGEILDYTGGLADLEKKVLRTVGNPQVRFREDYLRMLRAVRFAGKLGFTLEENTFAAIRELAPLIRELAYERIGVELDMMLTNPGADKTVDLLSATGLLAKILPEVEAMKGVSQPPEYHPEGDVWVHTMLMLSMLKNPSADLAWSVLLHDVGKPLTRSIDPDGRIRFFNHEKVGAEMASAILRRFHYSLERIGDVSKAISDHMRIASARQMKEAKLRRMIAEKTFELELELHRVDCLSSHKNLEIYHFLSDYLATCPAEKALPPPFITGDDLIKLGMVPGREFKPILDAMMDRQLSGEFENRQSALAALRKVILK